MFMRCIWMFQGGLSRARKDGTRTGGKTCAWFHIRKSTSGKLQTSHRTMKAGLPGRFRSTNMLRHALVSVIAGAVAVPVVSSQMIHITIPRRSEMTPVQKLNREGVAEVEKHRYEKAEGLFFKAYLYDPADPFTLNNLGYVAELQGQVDRAAAYYKLALQQGCDAVIDRSSDRKLKGHPMMDALGTVSNMPMRINRINTYAVQLIEENRNFEAQAVLKQVLVQDPKNAFTLNNLGVAEESVGDYESALQHYQAAAAIGSRQPVVVTVKRSSRGKPISEVAATSATDLQAKMSTMDMSQVRANMYAVRGLTALGRNDWDEARKDFEQSYQEDPQSAFALNNMGYLAEKDGELERAVSYYQRAQRARDAETRVGLATQPQASGQHLTTVARESSRDVDAMLRSHVPAPSPSGSEPIELIRRDGSPEPPVTTPEPESPSKSDPQVGPTEPRTNAPSSAPTSATPPATAR